MSLRRYHKKSRAGCTQCRSRRIKCDEQGPPCSNCNIRDMKCEYSSCAQLARQIRQDCDLSALRQEPKVSTSVGGFEDVPTNGSAFGMVTHSTTPIEWDQRRTELELTIHWTCQTCLTFCHQIGQKQALNELRLWQERLPRYALDHPYLLDAMFSLTSFHLATLTNKPSVKVGHATNGIRYYVSAINTFVEALSLTNEENCLVVYLCSLIILMLGIIIPQMAPVVDQQRGATGKRIKEIFEVFERSKRTLKMFRLKLDSEVMLSRSEENEATVYTHRYADFEQALTRLHRCNDFRLVFDDKSDPMLYHQRMMTVLRQLEACSVCLANGIDAALIAWLDAVEHEYVKSLKDGDALANLIMMHWAVLLSRSNDVWWNVSRGSVLIHQLSSCWFDFTDEEAEAYKWCHEQFAPHLCPVPML